MGTCVIDKFDPIKMKDALSTNGGWQLAIGD
jgi:hypothetical protein